MPLDLSQADSGDHCWLMDCYTDGCPAENIPTNATLVSVDDVITLTYDGTSKQLSVVVNKVCVCVRLCVLHLCVCVCVYYVYDLLIVHRLTRHSQILLERYFQL